MGDLSAVVILAVWDRARAAKANLQRALILLQLSRASEAEDVETLTMGQRDSRLLDLREQIFGSDIAALATCSCCGETLESRLQVNDVRLLPTESHDRNIRVEQGGQVYEFRLPTTRDLHAVSAVRAPEDRRRLLLDRLLASGALPEGIPDSVARKAEDRMAELDPQADIDLAFRCDACGEEFVSPFDIASFLWAELDVWARRTLRDVHTLARAYSWTETEILKLHPWRRQFYLEMLSE